MFIKDVNLDYIKHYLRVDDDIDDNLIQSLWYASISYIKSYTGMNDDDINSHTDLIPIALLYTLNLYDNRTIEVNERFNTGKGDLINKSLALYCKNNIAL